MDRVESRFNPQTPAAAVPQLDSREWMRRRRQHHSLFLCLHGHSNKRRHLALPKALLPLIELPGSYIMRAAVCRNALPAGFLRGYQFTPTLRRFCSFMTHESRMPPTACSLKMGFTQRSLSSDWLDGQSDDMDSGGDQKEKAALPFMSRGLRIEVRKMEVRGSGGIETGPCRQEAERSATVPVEAHGV